MVKKFTSSYGALSVAFLAAAILFAKAPLRILHGYLWAEDAAQFLVAAYSFGICSLHQEYAGYLHTIPRLITLFQWSVLPLRAAPHFFVIGCLLLSAASSAYLYRALLRYEWVRAPQLMATLMALVPWIAPQSGEVFLDITNLQWVLAPAFMVFIWETVTVDDVAQSRWETALRAICMLLLSTTGPFGVFALPIALLCVFHRTWMLRKPMSAAGWPVFATYLAGCGLQLVTYAAHRQVLPANDLVWVHELVAHLLATLLISPSTIDAHPPVAIWAAAAIGVVIVIGLTTRARLPMLMLLFITSAAWAGGILKSPSGTHFFWGGAGSRYTYPAGVFILWSIILVCGSVRWRSGVVYCTAIGAFIVLNGAAVFNIDGPMEWTIIRQGDRFMIQVPPGWKTEVPAVKG
ncbi:hypothetical protein [Paraburkholderia sp. HP33-1]|uniref:hypothetical protein n=1 Tax=Paraburkholderia sp. HP33-1 TaxID=2883243 RepID=UPI001F2AC57D|nr:hypothetical protein [Paraburkholderia sp. HP33-1]